jgi:uncharacterized membrane protein YcaP (DUF421 family)
VLSPTCAAAAAVLGELALAGARPTVHGIPVVIVKDGELLPDVLRRERLSVNNVYAAAREKGLPTLDDVELAVLEADGKISFFARSGKDSGPRSGHLLAEERC